MDGCVEVFFCGVHVSALNQISTQTESAVVVGSNPEQKGRRSVVPLTAVSTKITPGNAGAKQFSTLNLAHPSCCLEHLANMMQTVSGKLQTKAWHRVELRFHC